MRKFLLIATGVMLGVLLGMIHGTSAPTYAFGIDGPGLNNSPILAAAATLPADSFKGTITKQGEEFVLKSGEVTYRLDDQKTASQFEGKSVIVRGTLDKATNTIKVEAIEPA
jgi:hypothetical protein